MANENVFYDAVLKLVYEAGVIVREAYNRPIRGVVMTKSSAVDLVTETDQKVEELLIKGLSAQFPDHKFIGEESAASGQKVELTNAPTWIIDPIDGTTNFVHRLPFIGICIALYVEKQPRIGIVFNPILDELYSARAGQGAFKNGFPIHVSGTTGITSAVVMSTIGSCREEFLVQNFLNNFRSMMSSGGAQGHRSLGSAAINMCYIACGGADAYLEYGLHCWDVAASALIVKEAGGVNIDPSGGQFDIMARRILCAGSEQLARSIVGIIENVDFPRD